MKEVGSILNVSQRTATYHKYQIMKKLGATSTAELVRYAIKNHIVAAQQHSRENDRREHG